MKIQGDISQSFMDFDISHWINNINTISFLVRYWQVYVTYFWVTVPLMYIINGQSNISAELLIWLLLDYGRNNLLYC